MVISIVISLIALGISAISIYITFRKDTYQIKLKLKKTDIYRDFITITNDSVNALQVQAIGVVNSIGELSWIDHDRIGCSKTNRGFEFPVRIDGHISIEASFPQSNGLRAYLVQLPCGRTYGINHSLKYIDFLKLRLKFLASRITRGYYGLPKSYTHLRRYGVRD